ncbi:hypothetical protein E8E13_011075 [Curvularia kusanoi]|uniref:BTB domain-containing protein n=1 Tax=Curvularia kusanoi TaxID=90978 RepID=A0A9P4WCM3_CURKU|nr:hypothetical protein E8E13_011075 [Curvularia kusanoi]
MARTSHRTNPYLFNNQAFSDITLVHRDTKGFHREYHAHKAILCMSSEYFRKLFSEYDPNGKHIVLGFDDHMHFALLLKRMYSKDYDKAEIVRLAADDREQRILIPMGIRRVAEKYGVDTVYTQATEDVRAMLFMDETDDFLKAVVAAYYKDAEVDPAMRRIIVTAALASSSGFLESAWYKSFVKSFPRFAADMELTKGSDPFGSIARGIKEAEC